jgi:glycine betaine/proline transport system permease protein
MNPAMLDTALDNLIQTSLDWVTANCSSVFYGLRVGLDGAVVGIEHVLLYPPYYVIIVLASLLSLWTAGRGTATFTLLSLLLCRAMDLWEDSVATTALVALSTALSLAFAIPAGIIASSRRAVNEFSRPLVDLIQTMPSYVYLIPAVGLLGFDKAPGVVATVIVAIPPAFRLTNLGLRAVPTERVELGKVAGATGSQILWKVKIPSALPTIAVGINQTLMVALGMVVIAGIVGAGGLGAVVYHAINYLQIDKAVDGGLAIVILAINLDRISQGCIRLLNKWSHS